MELRETAITCTRCGRSHRSEYDYYTFGFTHLCPQCAHDMLFYGIAILKRTYEKTVALTPEGGLNEIR